MNHLVPFFLKKAFRENFSESKYCPYATSISMVGLVPLLGSIVLFFVSALKQVRVFSQVAILDLAICAAVCVAGTLLSNLLNRLAEWVSVRYINRMVRKSWEFADKYSLDNPSKLERCKELNPEFANKWMERQEREQRQDREMAQIAQRVRLEREQKRRERTGLPAQDDL